MSSNNPVHTKTYLPFLYQSRIVTPLNTCAGRPAASSRHCIVTWFGRKLVQLWLEDSVGSFTYCRRWACWVNKRLQHAPSHEADAELIQTRQLIICYNLKDIWWLLRAFSKALEGFRCLLPSACPPKAQNFCVSWFCFNHRYLYTCSSSANIEKISVTFRVFAFHNP